MAHNREIIGVIGPSGAIGPRGILGSGGGTGSIFLTDYSITDFIPFCENGQFCYDIKIRNTPLLKLIYKFNIKEIKIDEIKEYLENNVDKINSSFCLAPKHDYQTLSGDKTMSPLTLLVYIENIELIDVFLKAGANVNIIYNNKR